MKLYHLDANTGELVAERDARVVPGREKLPDSEPKKFLIPKHTTTIKPPGAKQGKARVFRNGAWEQEEDHRGKKRFDRFGNEKIVDVIGPLSDDEADEAQPSPDHEIKRGKWVVNAERKKQREDAEAATRQFEIERSALKAAVLALAEGKPVPASVLSALKGD